MTVSELPPRTVRSHELVGEYWFNSEPVPVAALRGNVVLLVFWDFSSVLSLRILDYVEAWYERYRDAGLRVVGIHSPRYDFAANPEAVLDAIGRCRITCPLVCDNSHQVAASYDIRVMPTCILIDAEGYVRFRNEGDRDPESTEHALRVLLHKAGLADGLPETVGSLRKEDDRGVVRYRTTPELRAGYVHRNIGNRESGMPETLIDFEDPGIYVEGKIYADGNWYNGREVLRFHGNNGGRGTLSVRYSALEVHAVFSPGKEGSAEVAVTMDGRALPEEVRGQDIRTTEQGSSVIQIAGARSYEIIRNGDTEEHLLCLSTGADDLSFYAFAFVAGAIPETISRN